MDGTFDAREDNGAFSASEDGRPFGTLASWGVLRAVDEALLAAEESGAIDGDEAFDIEDETKALVSNAVR